MVKRTYKTHNQLIQWVERLFQHALKTWRKNQTVKSAQILNDIDDEVTKVKSFRNKRDVESYQDSLDL